jgi:uncharacterized membrane protein
MMQKIFLGVMALLYIAAGINHFVHPAMYRSIMPSWLPKLSYGPLVVISGACEVLFGLLLFSSQTRVIAAWLIILLLIAVFPANIQMTIDFYRRHRPNAWMTLLRLPLQAALIAWAYKFTKGG